MPESFGVRLRQQRERQHIALATIAEQTKIKLSLLEELERDDVSHWPSGIFRRAFVRAYAHAIGLDQDVVVREFLEIHPEPPEVVETDPALSPVVDAVETRTAPPIRLRYLVGSAIDSLMRLGQRNIQQQSTAKEGATAAGAPMQEPPPAVQEAPPAPVQEAPPVPVQELPPAPVEEPPPAPVIHRPPEPTDLPRLARLCTDFARLNETGETAWLLQETAGMLDAVGLIVWAQDSDGSELRPALAHGYSDRVLAQLPRVSRDADNATAAAFRTAQWCVVRGGDSANGALAIPIMAPSGCVGVLAIEVKQGGEDQPRVRALATVVAAQLARLVDGLSPGAAGRRLA